MLNYGNTPDEHDDDAVEMIVQQPEDEAADYQCVVDNEETEEAITIEIQNNSAGDGNDD